MGDPQMEPFPSIYLLKEFPTGYGLFVFPITGDMVYHYRNHMTVESVRKMKDDEERFREFVKLVAFKKFDSEPNAVKQSTAFSKGRMTYELRVFLLSHLPEIVDGKKNDFSLGVADPELGYHMYEVAKIPCQSNEFVRELLLGVDLHINSFIKDFDVRNVDIANVDNKGGDGDVDGKKKESSEMDVEGTPMQPKTKKSKKRPRKEHGPKTKKSKKRPRKERG